MYTFLLIDLYPLSAIDLTTVRVEIYDPVGIDMLLDGFRARSKKLYHQQMLKFVCSCLLAYPRYILSIKVGPGCFPEGLQRQFAEESLNNHL